MGGSFARALNRSLQSIGLRAMLELAKYYLFAANEISRLSQSFIAELWRGRTVPKLSGSKQRMAIVTYVHEKPRQARILRVEGFFIDFDSVGRAQESLIRIFLESNQIYAQPSAATREKWTKNNRWVLNQRELDLVTKDISGLRSADVFDHKAAKAPRLTDNAKEAVAAMAPILESIGSRLEGLDEKSLVGLSEYVGREQPFGLDSLWQAVADAADSRREILRRHRTGEGIWVASIELLDWDIVAVSGTARILTFKRCASKTEAEETARQLLVEYAKWVSSHSVVSAHVVCELEWKKMRLGGPLAQG